MNTGLDTWLDEKWHHILIVNDGTDLLYYFDGSYIGTRTSVSCGSFNYQFLGLGYSHTYEYQGDLDEIRIYDKALNFQEIRELYREGVGTKVNLSDDNLVSYFPLDDSCLKANDSIDYYCDMIGYNHGINTGTNNATGLSSGAMRFDGVDDRITIANEENFDFDRYDNFSFSMWINPPDFDGAMEVMYGKGDWGVYTGQWVYLASGKPLFRHVGTWSERIDVSTSTALSSVNTWYHLVVTYNGSGNAAGVEFYVNNIKQGKTVNSDTLASSTLNDISPMIGSFDAVQFFGGIIDEVLIYNDTLSASEVDDLYKAGLTQHANANISLETRTASSYNISDSGLVSFWSFNTDNSTHAFDELGVNNGTLTGTVQSEDNGTVGMGRYFDGSDDNINITLLSSLNISQSWWQLNDSEGIWHHYVNTSDGTYKDGVMNTSATSVLDGHILSINVNSELVIGLYHNGSIDEVRLYNRSLSVDEIRNLYELGKYHIEWDSWQNEGKATSGSVDITNNYGNFMQVKFNFESDNTNVSAYLINHSIEDMYLTVTEGFCDSGDLIEGNCVLNRTYTSTDGQTIEGLNNLIIGSNGSIQNLNSKNSTTIGFKTITIQSGGDITGGNITIIADNLTVENGAVINVSYLGFEPNEGLGTTTANDFATDGAGHGGSGGESSYQPENGGKLFGSSLAPTTFGSGAGNVTNYAGGFGGSGGGIIRIDLSNTLILNGNLYADGKRGSQSSQYGAGGGAGGSVYITTNNITGSGVIQANGGIGGTNGFSTRRGGGGGGGRVAVYYNESSYNGISNSSVAGGSATSSATAGETGSLIFVDEDDNSATITIGFRFQDNLGIANESINTTFYTAGTNNYNFSTLTILNAIIDTEIKVAINITAINMSLDQNSTIDLDYRGYSTGTGPGASNNNSWGTGGAGHGGDGGDGAAAGSNRGLAYGSYSAPTAFGSGAGNDTDEEGYEGGYGGGAVILNVSDTLNLSGSIYVRGQNGQRIDSQRGPGGGSGGSIYIITSNLIGAGDLYCSGGSSPSTVDPDNRNGGGGAGGRIALITTTSRSWTGSYNVNGGSATAPGDSGSSGTFYTSPPIINSVTLNTTDLSTNDSSTNLTAYPDASYGNHTYIYNWYKNETPIMVLNMPFEAGSTSGLASGNSTSDYSGYDNDGTVYGATYNQTGGYDGFGGYEFDGSDDYITLPNNQFTDEATVSIWFNLKNAIANDVLIGGITPGSRFIRANTATNIDMRFGTTTVNSFTVPAINTDEWHHLVVTRDSSDDIRVYLDAVESSTGEINEAGTFGVDYIGRYGLGQYFEGSIDQIIIYNMSLSPEQILALYKNQSSVIVSNETTKNEVWKVTAYACDTVGCSSGTNSSNITILNAAPNTTQIVLNSSSDTNLSSENLTCYATIEDADLEDVYANYTWYKNDEENLTGQSSALTSGSMALISTILSDNTTKGQNWTCSIKAYDGTEYESDWNNATLTLLNAVPSISSVVLNTTNISNNNSLQNLTGYVSSSDSDGDNITYAYNWYKNGTLNATSLITDGLVAYYPLNNDTLDYYGSNDGSNSGAVRNVTDYKIGSAYTFNGSGNIIEIADDDSLDLKNDSGLGLTICMWAKKYDISDDFLLSKRFYEYELRYTPTSFAFTKSDGVGGYMEESCLHGLSNLNEWHYICLTWNITNSRFYLDAVALELEDNPDMGGVNPTPTDDLLIGRRLGTSSMDFNGTIDELMIFNRSLNASEIEMLYWAGVVNGHTMNSSRTTRNDNWTLGIKAGDYEGWSSETNSSGVLVKNALPVISSLVLNSTNVSTNYTDENLTVYVTVSDSDGDSMTYYYRWYRNQSYQLTTVDSGVLLSGNTTKRDVWNVGIIVYDGFDNTTEQNSSNITIRDAPPITVTYLNSSSPNNFTTDNLTCYATVTDPDGDDVEINYTWYRNGVENLVGGNSSFPMGSQALAHMLLSGNTSRGETWICSVRGFDGLSYGSWSNSSIRLGNKYPVISSVVLNSTNPELNNSIYNLTGYVAATDPEGDNITYAYNWYKNGSLSATTLITDGLVAYYPFNNDTLDYLSENNGTNYGASLNITGGKIAGAYSFDGVDDYIEIADNNSLDLKNSTGSGLTICLWAKKYDSSDDFLLSKWYHEYEIRYTGGGFVLTKSDGSGGYIEESCLFGFSDLDNWHHICLVWNITNSRFYADAAGLELEDNSEMGGVDPTPTSELTIGRRPGGSSGTFNGTIDELMIFNRSLNASEIEMLYIASVYGGLIMNSSRISVDDNWTLGIKAADSEDWSPETNSSSVFMIDIVNPTLVLYTPLAGVHKNFTIQNLTVNVSDESSGIKNITLTVYNITAGTHVLVDQSSMSFSGRTLNVVTGMNFTLAEGFYNWSYDVYDHKGNYNITENRSLVIDLTAPWNVTLYDPTPKHDSIGEDDVIFNWSVIDNYADNLSCYVTADDGDRGPYYTLNNTITSQAVTLSGGLRNISVTCYDKANNSNVSEYRSYIVGLLNITYPWHNLIVRPGETFNINVSILSGETYFDNITLRITDINTTTNLFTTNSSIYNYTSQTSYTVPNKNPHIINITAIAFNTTLGSSINVTYTRLIRLARSSSNTSVPTISYDCPNQSYSIVGDTVLFSSIFDLDTLVGSVNISVKHPNNITYNTTHVVNSTDNNGSNNYINHFNFSYIPNESGTYIITFSIMDIENQTVSENRTLKVSSSKTINWSGIGVSNLSLRDICSNRVLIKDNAIIGRVPTNAIFNLGVEFSSEPKDVLFKDINITYDNLTDIVNLTTLTNETEAPSNERRVALFDLHGNMSFSNFTLTYNYSSVAHTLSDENNLKVHVCPLVYSNVTNTTTCSLVEQTITINTTNKTVTLFRINLSRYMVTETAETIIQTGSSGSTGGGGGSSTKIRKVAFTFIPTSPLRMYSDDTITATIIAKNIGEVDFRDIDVDIISDSDSISVRPTEELIDRLDVDELTSFDVDITSHGGPGIYEVNIIGNSSDPDYLEESRIVIQILEREVEVPTNNTEIVEKIAFAYDLFKENPECLELQEMIDQAEEAVEKEEFEKASSLLEAAVNACKEAVTSLNLPSIEQKSPPKLDMTKWIMVALILTLISWLGMELWHRRARRGKYEIKFEPIARTEEAKPIRKKDAAKPRAISRSNELARPTQEIKSKQEEVKPNKDIWKR